jgi:hypothetical protein
MSNMQGGWRSCSKCQGMHFALMPNSEGVCPAGGQHDHANSFLYSLMYDAQPTPNLQTGWASCQRCQGMHFGGFPLKGVCPAGGQHSEAGSFAYAIAHDGPASSNIQSDWRSCSKCQGLFYGPFKGRCPTGGAHVADGSFNYALPYAVATAPPQAPQSSAFNWSAFSAGKVTVESASLTISSTGDWTWKGALHDSSTLFGDNWALGFAFDRLGHGSTTSGSLGATFSGPSADGGFTQSGTDPWLAANYAAASASTVTCSLHVEGDFGQLLNAVLEDLKAAADVAEQIIQLLQKVSISDPPGDPDPGPDPDPGGGDDETDSRRRQRPPHDPNAVPASAMAKASKSG